MTQQLERDILEHALTAYAVEHARTLEAIKAIKEKLATPAETTTHKRTMSAAARKRISEAQKARWAKRSGDVHPPVIHESLQAKRTISAAGRRAISKAAKSMWRKRRKLGLIKGGKAA